MCACSNLQAFETSGDLPQGSLDEAFGKVATEDPETVVEPKMAASPACSPASITTGYQVVSDLKMAGMTDKNKNISFNGIYFIDMIHIICRFISIHITKLFFENQQWSHIFSS